MKKTAVFAILLLCLPLLISCAGREHQLPDYRCQSPLPSIVDPELEEVYGGRTDVCLAFLRPFDVAGWYESKMNSRRVRGQTLKIGCTTCPAAGRDCTFTDNAGGCYNVSLFFDFAKIQEDAQIRSAKLALYVTSNPEALNRALLQARIIVGSDFQALPGAPERLGKWALYDITDFVCGCVNERRNSVMLDISLPCGAGRMELATLALDQRTEPAVIIEYR